MPCVRLAICIALGSAAMLAAAHAGEGKEPRALVELFTSQGCSACPPADKLLGELGRDPTLVTLSLPIDYWDYLGWKDTLALPGHAKRQYGYAKARGDRRIYTPQAVVNGLMHVLGSDRQAIAHAILQSREAAATMRLPVALSVAGGRVVVSLPEMAAARGEVWLSGVRRAVPIRIERGENRGRTVTYHNVARSWHRLGEWTGAAASWSLALSELDDADDAVVIVQERTNGYPGRVLGAARAALH